MAHDGLSTGVARPRMRIGPWIMDAAFVGLMLLAFVGMEPFALRNPATDLSTGPYTATGMGDTVRQVFYIAIFVTIVTLAFLRRGLAVVAAVPPMLALLLAWCLASTLWAASPEVAFRRAVLEVIVVLCTVESVDILGVSRTLKIWRWVLAGILIVNWLSIPLVHQAIHLPGEQDPSLIGDWRGLYFHKNIAGAVSAMSVIVFFFFALRTGRWTDIALCLAALGFTVMTKSKSSMGLLVVALAFGLTYRFAWRKGVDRTIVAVAALLVVFVVAAFAYLNADAIAHMLEDPTEFTGRSAIWQAEIAFVRDHPFLGSGFGTFADTGSLSPLHNYVGAAWVETVAHGHNGYLQMLVTIGSVGFLVAIVGLVIDPAVRFWGQGGSELPLKSLLFTMFVFLILHNFMESDFLEGDAPAWVAFLMMMAMLRATRTTPGPIWRAP